MNIATQTAPDIEQFLTFRLGEEQFGVQIQQVQGIQGWDRVTELPDTPPHVLGVIDLRGTVVPIIDLRRRLGFKRCEFTATTVVIVVKVRNDEDSEQTFGLVVDAVSEVCDVPESERKPSPDFGGGIRAEYILGLAANGERMVILLDLDRLMNDAELPEHDDDESAEVSVDASASLDEAAVDEALAADAEDPVDVDAIEQSFALLAPQADELISTFYDKLFEAYPDVRPMFAETDMVEQKRKLLGAIKLVVENVRTPGKLDGPLSKLGAAHAAMGAEPAHYEAVAGTMLATLAELAGEAWTTDLETAWGNALRLVAGKMLAGAAAADSGAQQTA